MNKRIRTTLLTTVAAAAVVGWTAMAAAQGTMEPNKGAAKPAATESQKAAPGGGAIHQQGATQRPGQSAQDRDQTAKPEQRLGQKQKKDMTPQRGAQDDRGAPENGAQQKRAQEERGAQDESGKSGANANGQHANESQDSSKSPHGAAVQLSDAQRTKIQGIIGKGDTARVTTKVNFNIAVGATIPHDVHVEVLPEDVVEIVPQYEGFDYIVVGDQILIVDPDSLAIVAIIET
jgi:flagellar motor protein MotB